MKRLALFLIAIATVFPAFGGDDRPLTIGFWNVENLFDLVDDPAKNDDEFTPQGRKKVTAEILDLKLDHLAEVLTNMNVDLVGLAEVENRLVLEMLNERYTGRDYTIIHYESPDVRGIDVALLFDERRFTVLASRPISVDLENHRPTRDILYVEGEYGGQTLYLFVNHWPSHWGGTEATNPLREKTAITLRREINKILEREPAAEIIVMGDLNDQPTAESVTVHLSTTLSEDSVSVGKSVLWNLMFPFLDKPHGGSYEYRGKDLVYDQIIVSPGLADSLGLSVVPRSQEIVDGPRYRQTKGQYAGYPFRFWAGDSLLGGYSDHLPVRVSVVRR